MVGTKGDRPSGCDGAGGSGSGWGRREVNRRDGSVGDDGQELKTGDIM